MSQQHKEVYSPTKAFYGKTTKTTGKSAPPDLQRTDKLHHSGVDARCDQLRFILDPEDVVLAPRAICTVSRSSFQEVQQLSVSWPLELLCASAVDVVLQQRGDVVLADEKNEPDCRYSQPIARCHDRR